MEEQKEQGISQELLQKLHKRMDEMSVLIERTRISEYVEMNQKPWKLVLFNFLGGIGRGFGIAIGMTLVAAIVIIILTKILASLITFPVIGKQIAQLVELVNQYMKEGSKLNIQ